MACHYDETFSTVPSTGVDDDELEAIWLKMFHNDWKYYGLDVDSGLEKDKPPPLHEDWLMDEEVSVGNVDVINNNKLMKTPKIKSKSVTTGMNQKILNSS